MYELARVGDVAAMYEHALTWLRRDRKRYELQRLKALFEEPAVQAEPAE